MPTYIVRFATWADDASIGTKVWNLPGNAEFVDGAVASATSNLSVGSHYLVGSAPTAFSPAVNEILSSIDAVITREAVPAVADTVVDRHFYLVKGGVFKLAVDKADGSTPWPVAYGDATYTWSSAELATLGITLADCADPGFGVAFACIGQGAGVVGGNIDAIVLTIHTTTAMGTDVPPLNIIPPYGVRFQ